MKAYHKQNAVKLTASKLKNSPRNCANCSCSVLFITLTIKYQLVVINDYESAFDAVTLIQIRSF